MMIENFLVRPKIENEFIENKEAANLVTEDEKKYLEKIEECVRTSIPKENLKFKEVSSKDFEKHFGFKKKESPTAKQPKNDKPCSQYTCK